MKSSFLRAASVLACVLLGFATASRADLWETLGLKKRAKALVELTEDEIGKALREALAQGVERSVAKLGQTNGFLSDAKIRIPMPTGLQTAESMLRKVGQGKMVDDFVAALNRAAEQAVPESGPVLGDAIRQMTMEDARQILNSTNTAAATDFFRRTSHTNLQTRLLPLVKKATDQAGVTSNYKRLLDKAGMGSSSFLGGIGRSVLGVESLDVDDYVTRKTLDGLFVKIAEEEKRIRENPAARATALLQRVFGSAGK
jgi:Protein of unknown function (DUF4197)